jgi:hypothetical protein
MTMTAVSLGINNKNIALWIQGKISLPRSGPLKTRTTPRVA